MAVKISNTTVIDNDRNFTNANNGTFIGTSHIKLPSGNTAQRPSAPLEGGLRYNTEVNAVEGLVEGTWKELKPSLINLVATPTNVDPANAATGVTLTNPVLEGSPYFHVYGKAKANGQWQISNTSNFSTTVVDQVVSGNSVTYTTSVTLPATTKHFWRVRYQDSDGVYSNYSTATEFTTGVPPGPTTLGESFGGGFYTGTIDVSGTCYYLIVSPNATGCACCQWKFTRTLTPGTTSFVNGYTNTYGPLTDGIHPAGEWTATRTIGGFSDWYLPARDELNIMYTNKGSMPAGEGYAGSLYWSSVQNDGFPDTRAQLQYFNYGSCAARYKTDCYRVRAVRRQPI